MAEIGRFEPLKPSARCQLRRRVRLSNYRHASELLQHAQCDGRDAPPGRQGQLDPGDRAQPRRDPVL